MTAVDDFMALWMTPGETGPLTAEELRALGAAGRLALDESGYQWRDFTPTPRPKGMRKRADKACFLNALRIVHDNRYPGLKYAEGMAWGVCGPTHHAWVVDEDGNAIDPTWSTPASRYYGATLTVTIANAGGPSLPVPITNALSMQFVGADDE